MGNVLHDLFNNMDDKVICGNSSAANNNSFTYLVEAESEDANPVVQILYLK